MGQGQRGATSPGLPTPRAFFGFAPGSDGRLADWPALQAYFALLATRTRCLQVLPLGTSVEGRPLVALALGAPAVLGALEAIATRATARAAGLGPAASDPPGVPEVTTLAVLAGVHALETAAPQGIPSLVHDLLTRGDAIARAVRRQLLLLIVPAVDPDGLTAVCAWMAGGPGRRGPNPPGLYRRYAGHDINRDWIMQTQPEIAAVARGVYQRFVPQVVLDLHEMWQHGPRLFLPPYAAPADPACDPETITMAGRLGQSMAAALDAQGLAGVATGVIFDAFSPARCYPHYHGAVRILCEVAGAGPAGVLDLPTDRLRPSAGFDPRAASAQQPRPWPGGRWSARDVARYQAAAAWACLELVAREAPAWRRWQAQAFARARDPRLRPGAHVVAPAQPDPDAAAALVAALQAGGLSLHMGRDGSVVVPRAQPYGPWADTLLQAQVYPAAPAGPVAALPYDVTAHHLPTLMGVTVHLEPTDPVPEGPAASPEAAAERDGLAAAGPGPQVWPAGASGSYATALAALAAGRRVWRIAGGADPVLPPGGALVTARQAALLPAAWRAVAEPLVAPRLAIYGSWKASSDESWLRWVLDHFGQGFAVVRDRDIHAGQLAAYSHLILPSVGGRDLMHGLAAERGLAEFAGGLGPRGREEVRRFVAAGGRLLAVEEAAGWAQAALDLGVEDATLARRQPLFVPGALLPLEPRPGPLALGISSTTAALYRGGPAFLVGAEQAAAVFAPGPPLAGWAVGHEALSGTAAVARIACGRGLAVLYAFSPYFRAQSWGAFRWLLNALLL